ncbi:MAG: MarR family transcriptional regulator [Pseudomonadota bacterium]
MTTTPLKLDDHLCFSIYAAAHAFNRLYKPVLDDLGLTYPQYLTMVALWQEDGQRVSSIGEKLYLESSTLTPLLKRLEAAGLVTRERDRADERQVLIRLTDAGRALQDRAGAVPACVLNTSGMSIAELQALNREVQALRRVLDRSAA